MTSESPQTANRMREEEAYYLFRLQGIQVVAVDCPVGRLVALGAAAVGAGIVLAPRVCALPPGRQYLVPGRRDEGSLSAQAFVTDTLRRWFPDVPSCVAPAPYGATEFVRMLEALRLFPGQLQFVVLPAEPWALTIAWQLSLDAALQRRCAYTVRLARADANGVCLVRPDESCDPDAVRDLLGPSPSDDSPRPQHTDAAMIAAGVLLHEARLFSGATLRTAHRARQVMPEAYPMAPVCRLELPPPPPARPGAAVCVGAGGIGSALCMFGIAASAPAGHRLHLLDGDTCAPHNILLHQHRGQYKVLAVQQEAARLGSDLDLCAEPIWVDASTPMPQEADLLYAVTDSAHSRFLAQEAFSAQDGSRLMVSGGSTVTGAEAFCVRGPGRAACIRCRYPHLEAEVSGQGDCSRRPATFASNLIAAGFAYALGRRAADLEFLTSGTGISRFSATTHDPARFTVHLPQRCDHES